MPTPKENFIFKYKPRMKDAVKSAMIEFIGASSKFSNFSEDLSEKFAEEFADKVVPELANGISDMIDQKTGPLFSSINSFIESIQEEEES